MLNKVPHQVFENKNVFINSNITDYKSVLHAYEHYSVEENVICPLSPESYSKSTYKHS